MNNYLTKFILCCIILTFIGCSDSNSIIEVETNKIFAKVFVEVKNTYYNIDSGKVVVKPNLDFRGELIGENITTIEYILIGTDTVAYGDSYSIDRNNWGVINFNTPTGTFIEPSFPKRFLIKTTIGSIEGTIVMPDSVKNIEYDKQDSLNVGESLLVNFTSEEGDYFKLNYALFYELSTSPVTFNEFGEKISRENSVLIDSTVTFRNGTLQISSIEIFKGPFPEDGSVGNMTGDGMGYLYTIRKQYIYDYFKVVN